MRKFLQWRIYTDLFTPRVNNNFAISTELLLGVCFNIVSINIPIIQCPSNILIFAISIRGHFVSQFHLSNKSFAICPRMFFNNLVSMHFIFKMIKPITSRNFCVSVFTNTILRIRIFEVKALSGIWLLSNQSLICFVLIQTEIFARLAFRVRIFLLKQKVQPTC